MKKKKMKNVKNNIIIERDENQNNACDEIIAMSDFMSIAIKKSSTRYNFIVFTSIQIIFETLKNAQSAS